MKGQNVEKDTEKKFTLFGIDKDALQTKLGV